MVATHLLRTAHARLYGPVVVEGDVDAAVDAVFDVLADPTTYPDWLVGARDTRRIDDDFPAPGSSFDHTVGAAPPLSIDDSTEALGTDGRRHLALLVHAGPFHARVDFELLRAPEGRRTHVRFSEQPVGPVAVLTPLLRPSLFARNRESLRRLADAVRSPAAT